MPRSDTKKVKMLSDSPDPVTGLYTAEFWIAHPWYVRPDFANRWSAKSVLSWLFGGPFPTMNGPWKESGYDLRTIGPAAQEKRGTMEMQEIYQGLQDMGYASQCPFHI